MQDIKQYLPSYHVYDEPCEIAGASYMYRLMRDNYHFYMQDVSNGRVGLSHAVYDDVVTLQSEDNVEVALVIPTADTEFPFRLNAIKEYSSYEELEAVVDTLFEAILDIRDSLTQYVFKATNDIPSWITNLLDDSDDWYDDEDED